MEGDCLCPEQWSDTFGSHDSVKCLAKVSDNMRKTVLNVAQRWPQEASCFKYIFQRGRRKKKKKAELTVVVLHKPQRQEWLLKWSDDKRLIWSLIQWKGLAAGLKTQHTHRKEGSVNFTAEGTHSSTPLQVLQHFSTNPSSIYICLALIDMSEHRPQQDPGDAFLQSVSLL